MRQGASILSVDNQEVMNLLKKSEEGRMIAKGVAEGALEELKKFKAKIEDQYNTPPPTIKAQDHIEVPDIEAAVEDHLEGVKASLSDLERAVNVLFEDRDFLYRQIEEILGGIAGLKLEVSKKPEPMKIPEKKSSWKFWSKS